MFAESGSSCGQCKMEIILLMMKSRRRRRAGDGRCCFALLPGCRQDDKGKRSPWLSQTLH